MDVQTAYFMSVRHRFVFCNDFRGRLFWGAVMAGGGELSEPEIWGLTATPGVGRGQESVLVALAGEGR